MTEMSVTSPKSKKKELKLGQLTIPAPAIVASLSGDASTKALAAEKQGADIIEVRLDLVDGDPLEVIKIVRNTTRLPIIATNRMREEGGSFSGTEMERIKLLLKAAKWANLIDIELRAELRELALQSVDKPVIISYHDFQGTSTYEELKGILEDIINAGADVAKIAVTTKSLADNLAFLGLLLETTHPTCMIGMSDVGRHLRAVAPLYGSVLTYGYLDEATAPGQMSVSQLHQALGILGASSG
jgi:3-dehydroquinate dehydratase-1